MEDIDAVRPRHVTVEITQASVARGALESGGRTSETIRAPAPLATLGTPPAIADEASSTEALACLVCLEEDDVADGDMLHDICACKTTAIHRVCLEKLVNSRRRRRLSIEERMACPVCTRRFTVPHERTLLTQHAGGFARPNRRGVARTLSTAIALSFLVSFSARVIATTIGRQLVLLFLTFLMFGFLFYVVYGGTRCRPRARPGEADAPPDPDELDDEQFYTQVVLAHAADLERYRLHGEAQHSHRMVVHIRRPTCVEQEAAVASSAAR
jgi:hypothetical protein